MSLNKIGKSYEYRAYCEVCKFKLWNYELKKRWDGLWVCKDDFEYRHPLDFYRTRNDAHKLPFILSSDGAASSATPDDHTWTPTISAGLTSSAVSGETYTANVGSYLINTTDGFTYFNSTITWLDANSEPIGHPVSTTTSSATTYSLPTTATGVGTIRVMTSFGAYLGSGTIAASATTVTLPNWTKKMGHLYFSGKYIT